LRIEVTRRPGTARLLPVAEVRRIVREALRAAGAPRAATASVVLAGDVELAELNEAHMGHHGPTDVLSFPLLPPAAFPPHPGQDRDRRMVSESEAAFALPPDVPPHLGDIVVSVERALAQAAEGRGGQQGDESWTPEDELRLLLVHGALHLCGWDHAEPEERDAMRSLERRILGPR
jgi:probable rRNA maturation factor